MVPQYDMNKVEMCQKLKADVLFVGDDWYGTEKWQKFEKELEEIGTRVVYFLYTKGVSSTKITKALKDLRSDTHGN